ncbi:apolipoprotein N-acyltransferase [Motilibacter rhizosphaerae]|uniref:Apolipoprotein N-acyltransferase n=1 Tax=Motilibacter rhizosphaerae TaxID=598652 RepID=A0A4V2F2U3_9ACTN|nr:apolipoprotein N-acyltransferase [Motilibacter rhizosphaerae]RZS80094.1 apolipoprotein N-acyltransferase [Motilibacter rhizosphaerae]
MVATAAPPAAPAPAAARRSPGLAPRLLLAVLSGVAGMLAFPPYSLEALAPVSVALLALAVRGLGLRRAALVGLVGGAAFFGPLLHWTGIYVGPVPWLALAASQAAWYAGLGVALALVARLPWPLWVLGTATSWTLQEALRGRLPYGGFPWGRLGFALADTPYAHLARTGGVPLVSAAAALTGGGLAAVAVLLARRPRAATAALLAGLVPVLGPLAVPFAQPHGRTVQVALVQGDVPRMGLDFNAQRAAVLDNHAQRTHELAARVRSGAAPKPDLVLWPENSSDLDPFSDPQAYATIAAAVDDIGVPVLVGAVVDGPGRDVSNTGIVWLPGSGPVSGPHGQYVKRHPVPFAEYIPMRRVARLFSSDVDRVARDFAHGKTIGALDLPVGGGTVRIGDVICFEIGYDGLVRDAVRAGGSVVVTQTNNATFGRTPQTVQQLQMSRLRAQESGRAALVVATSGVSAVIAPDGTVEQRTALFTPDVLEARVRLARAGEQTLAIRWGVAPEVALSLVAAVLVLVGARREEEQ